ncbi:putative secreted protein [Phaeomoniella chlamydospora]|uniref:Putative secreted protein n=1 Tax=Phaeomoniella chlamydospora TaxID=158046 RepID=A0A0G2ECN3_PHACM|nr:putative secreted protein [Phaeomoniella chlamydospora]
MSTERYSLDNNKVQLQWLSQETNGDEEGYPFSHGTTFGIPWPQGKLIDDETAYQFVSNDGLSQPLQSWTTAYWPDNSIKWTAHAVSGIAVNSRQSYTVHAHLADKDQDESIRDLKSVRQQVSPSVEMAIEHLDFIEVNTRKIRVTFPRSGMHLIGKVTAPSGKIIGEEGHLVLKSKFGSPDEPSTASRHFQSRIHTVKLEQRGHVRCLVTISGHHVDMCHQGSKVHSPWLPYILRFYFYMDSHVVRILHSIVFDGDASNDFISGIGIRFKVPFHGEELVDRHVRFAGVNGGMLSEAVQGVTGLRIDPGHNIRSAQVMGRSVYTNLVLDQSTPNWLKYVLTWNDFTLTQVSPDGFGLQKRTSPGQSWVKLPGGTRADGLVYLGSATSGGLALGMKDFWERYPTQIDIRNATSHSGEITLWLYSPSAEPMDLRPYHDGLNQVTYDDQLNGLEVTYEDWEPDQGTPYGIARTNELYLFGFQSTPEQQDLSTSIRFVRTPPQLIPDRGYIRETGTFGTCWSCSKVNMSQSEEQIETNLSFLFHFYRTQVEQRRWYGFWDYGDIMHTYDDDRHTWRYDIGGYAWDNSELSPDLWLWLYFLRTGRSDVYRFAEQMTRHTGEVDVYHMGKLKGLGTRHGVQHWSDSCKQIRISNVLYRRPFYYLSGGDERTGDLLDEVLEAPGTFLMLDPYRKVRANRGSYEASSKAINISLGTEWSALASVWFMQYERRKGRWQDALNHLLTSMSGIAKLPNGFFTGRAILDLETGDIRDDLSNGGRIQISHLSAMFGLAEICADLIGNPSATTEEVILAFKQRWLDYCRLYNASAKVQQVELGVSFPKLQLGQGHSRLTAFAANQLNDHHLARRAWHEFFTKEGYPPTMPWKSIEIQPHHATLIPGTLEATWITTNFSALYGLAAIQNLAYVGEYLQRK